MKNTDTTNTTAPASPEAVLKLAAKTPPFKRTRRGSSKLDAHAETIEMLRKDKKYPYPAIAKFLGENASLSVTPQTVFLWFKKRGAKKGD